MGKGLGCHGQLQVYLQDIVRRLGHWVSERSDSAHCAMGQNPDVLTGGTHVIRL